LVIGSALVVFLVSITFLHGIGGRGGHRRIHGTRLTGAVLIASLSVTGAPLPTTISARRSRPS
jgi:hypothetical protein